ncbi:MAG: MurR/RpiR family transcriptional regulator [Candidatus Accumulibacter sp.]|jgi:DNA-binding MurR/RpiR family transcriptional regulator|nr:MurR/RpiR family transcriptional regulator [Accumulibacter sp.]
MDTPAPHLLQHLQERYADLPEAQQRVVDLIARDPRGVAGATVQQLAQRAGVSMPTIVRACRSFGFDSVREFMLALVHDIALIESPPYRYLHRSVRADDAPADICGKILRSVVTSMSALEDELDVAALERAATAIAAAERIDCYSSGATSTFIANDFQARLFRLGLHSNAYFDAHQQLISACTLGPRGVAVAVSHVGRMPTLLEATRFARSQGATVIALTQPGAPLAVESDIMLGVSVPEDAVMRVGTEAYIAHLLIVEMITVLVGQRLGSKAADRLRQFRGVLAEHGIDSESHVAMTMSWSRAERVQSSEDKEDEKSGGAPRRVI